MSYFHAVRGVGAGIGAMLGYYFVTLDLDDYSSTFLFLSVLGGCAVATASCAPETLVLSEKKMPIVRDESLTGEPSAEDAASAADGTRRCDKRRGGSCGAWGLIFGSRTILLLTSFVFCFVFGASSLTISQSFMTSEFEWSDDTVTLAGIAGGAFGFGSLLASGQIIPRLGALLSVVVASFLATAGILLMAVGSQIHHTVFMLGFFVLFASAFGVIAYVQYISARVDPNRMGALQGGIAAFALSAWIIGSNLSAVLNRDLPIPQRWSIFLGGGLVSAVGCVIALYLYSTRDWKQKRDARRAKAAAEQAEEKSREMHPL
jgi:MFS family permease